MLMSVPFGPSASRTSAEIRPRVAGTAAARHHQVIAAPGQRDEIGDIFVRHVGLRPRSVPDHVHPERLRPIRDGAADAAEADHAERLAADAAAERQRPFQPRARAHEAVGEHDLARGGEHHADGEVGTLVGEDARRVGHGDVALARCGKIDGVDADAEAGDDLELRERLDQRPGRPAVRLGGDAADAAFELGAQRPIGKRVNGVVMILEALREGLHGRGRKGAEGENDGLHELLENLILRRVQRVSRSAAVAILRDAPIGRSG